MQDDHATQRAGPANGGAGAPPDTPPSPPAPGLGRELGGDLPCVVCRYNLRGLSIRSMCPECGTGVRATILSLVDPQAGELRPIAFPRAIAAGVVLWAFGAVLAAVMSWLPHIADLLGLLGVKANRPSALIGVTLGVAISGIGSLALIRPHGGIGRSVVLAGTLASVLYIPLTWLLWRYHDLVDGPVGWLRLPNATPNAEAAGLLAVTAALIAVIIMLERPAARLLVARSMVMRTGRVDRQTLYAMAIAACIQGVGALLLWFGARAHTASVAEVLGTLGVLLVAFGSVLLTIGALGALLDCARIAGAIIIPKLTLRQVIREGRPEPRSRLMRVIDPTPPGATPTILNPPADSAAKRASSP